MRWTERRRRSATAAVLMASALASLASARAPVAPKLRKDEDAKIGSLL